MDNPETLTTLGSQYTGRRGCDIHTFKPPTTTNKLSQYELLKVVYKGNNKITELRTILQRESQIS